MAKPSYVADIEKYADEKQRKLHTHFSNKHPLANPKVVHHVLLWNTFFRRNLHRLAIDYLHITVHLYQAIILFILGRFQFVAIIASRSAAKSFIVALWACCECIVRPYSQVVITSATRGQSKLIISEKIQGLLMPQSPQLRNEIEKIVNNQNDVVVYFKNHSTITVVSANDNARGYRSTAALREEFRMIDKHVDDSVISPFQVIRQAPYTRDPFYASMKEIRELAKDIYISSSWLDNGHWMWNIVDQTYEDMLEDKSSFLLAFDISIPLLHNIKALEQLIKEKRKQDPLTWRIEFLNERVKENTQSFFSYGMFKKNQNVKKPFYPRIHDDVRAKRKNPHDISKQSGEIRVVSCDMAFIEDKKNDASVFTCLRLLPETVTYGRSDNGSFEMSNGYRRIVPYIESCPGGDTTKQARRIRQIYEDFHADYIVLDMRNAGRDALCIWKLCRCIAVITGTLRCESEGKIVYKHFHTQRIGDEIILPRDRNT